MTYVVPSASAPGATRTAAPGTGWSTGAAKMTACPAVVASVSACRTRGTTLTCRFPVSVLPLELRAVYWTVVSPENAGTGVKVTVPASPTA